MMPAKTHSNRHLSEDYQTACCDEAERVFDFRSKGMSQHPVVIWETHTNKPLVWVVPDLLTQNEYQYVLEQIHQPPSTSTTNAPMLFGKNIPHKLQLADFWMDGKKEGLSSVLLPRIQHEYQQHSEKNSNSQKAATDEFTDNAIHSVISGWRIVKLTEDEEFPAHQDGMDQDHDESTQQVSVSTHSVILDFVSRTTETAELEHPKSGAIRFYYRQYPFDGPYHYRVDVYVPPGWAIIMAQRADLWYAFQPNPDPTSSVCRYVAQTGLLQQLPSGMTVETLRHGGPVTFSLGPGLMELLEAEAEAGLGDGSPRGWGQQSIDPKATLWRLGKPLMYARSNPATARSKYVASRDNILPGLAKERRWSMVNQTNTTESILEKARRRKSLQFEVDPVRNQVSYSVHPNLPKKQYKNDEKNECDSVTSRTVEIMDFSESYRSEDESFVIHAVAAAIGQSHDHQRRQPSIQVTRKPKRDSKVGKLVEAFQSS